MLNKAGERLWAKFSHTVEYLHVKMLTKVK